MFKLSRDIGIDLGTSNVLIYVEGKGVVVREPAVVAVDKSTGRVLQVGSAARNMLGRTPGNVVALRPLRDGVICDYEMTQKLLTQLVRKAMRMPLVKPRAVVCVPSGVTGVEERAVIQATMEAGARRVYLIEEPLAAALGAELNLDGAEGHMVVDVGGGTTDIAVLSMNSVAVSSSVKVAGDAFDDAIARFIRRRYGVAIGANTAEEIKMTIGCVADRPDDPAMQVKGRDLKTGLPHEFLLRASETGEALRRPAREIIEEIQSVLQQTQPELVVDVSKNGIVLTGGGSRIWGLDRLIAEATGIACTLADDAESCVAFGCGKSLKWIGQMQEGTMNFARKKQLEE